MRKLYEFFFFNHILYLRAKKFRIIQYLRIGYTYNNLL